MLTILGRVTSVNVRKATWAADELGLSYKREDWGLPIRDPKVPEFLALNPNGTVPVLLDDDFVLWESIAIMVYLDQKAGGDALLPADPRQRAIAMQWLLWQTGELGPNWGYALNAIVRKTPGYDDPQKLANSLKGWTSAMGILEAHLAQSGDFVGGFRFTLADIGITLGLHRWFTTPFDHPPMPASLDYYERMKQRPAAAPWLTPQTP
ncbi:glutathione S-transferase family protein [Devosia sp. 2618]|uniref:glutathione S-transferase family protein n=1 Tax=Devosia sp. 2618 TaxID=3156454 RepID=UPI003397FC7C